MKHHKSARKFGRERKGRRALLRSLARALIGRGAIVTTEARAKELRPMVERLVTLGKEDTPARRRLVSARLGGAARETKQVFAELAPRFEGRAGGYTRITKMPAGGGRTSARIAFLE